MSEQMWVGFFYGVIAVGVPCIAFNLYMIRRVRRLARLIRSLPE